MKQIDVKKLFQIANPNRTLNLTKKEDKNYYIDFSEVRGSNVLEKISRTIIYSEKQPTCQLFTGHIGCGKTTELSKLQAELKDNKYHIIYFESSQYLDMGDLDISDILLVIAQQIIKNLEAEKIKFKPSIFKELMQGVANILNSEFKGLKLKIPGFIGKDTGTVGITQKEDQFSISFGIGEIIAKARDSKNIRSLLRDYLEPRIQIIINALNKEVIEPAQEQLNKKGKAGLVIIIDNLDRIDNREKSGGRKQPEYLFVDRGEQLNRLTCHVIYTIPLVLTFSNEQANLINRFGSDPYMLPMVRVKQRDGQTCCEGLKLMKQMILKLAFPEEKEELLQDKYITTLFRTSKAFDYICAMSGGHIRNLLVLFHSCLKEDDPPFSESHVEQVARQRRNDICKSITKDEWELLKKVNVTKKVSGEEEYQTLLRSLFVYEYQDDKETWFDINPLLEDSPELQD